MSQETFKLQFTDGPRAGEEIPLADSLTTLGQRGDNTIVVNNPSIAAKHLTFYVEDDGVNVETMSSDHATQLNEQQVEGRQILSHGDALIIGDLHINVISVNETLNDLNRMDIFGHPDEIEDKFNSESQLNIRQVVKATPAQQANPDSSDEITGVFDFSEMQKGQALPPQLDRSLETARDINENDGTVPLAPRQSRSPMVLIAVLCTFIILLLGFLVYMMFFHAAGLSTESLSPAEPVLPEFVAPTPEP